MENRIISYRGLFSDKVYLFKCVSTYYQADGIYSVDTDTCTLTSMVPGIGELRDLLQAILYSVPPREFNGGVGAYIDYALKDYKCTNMVRIIGAQNGRPEWRDDVTPDSAYEFYAIVVDYNKENSKVTYTLYRCLPV